MTALHRKNLLAKKIKANIKANPSFPKLPWQNVGFQKISIWKVIGNSEGCVCVCGGGSSIQKSYKGEYDAKLEITGEGGFK